MNRPFAVVLLAVALVAAAAVLWLYGAVYVEGPSDRQADSVDAALPKWFDVADAADAQADPQVPANPDRAPAVASGASAEEAVEIQVCGGRWLPLDAAGRLASEAGAAFERDALAAVVAPTLAAMRLSRDGRRQAAGLFFEAMHAAEVVVPASPACRGQADACPANPANPASPASPASTAAVRPEPRDALARLAAASTDPQVYAWAWQACHAGSPQPEPSGACQMLRAGQWARLDPSNAAPWLAVATSAAARRDAVDTDDAMYHVASADRHDAGSSRLAAVLVAAAPAGDANLLGVWLLARRASGLAAPRPDAGLQAAKAYCSSAALADVNRRETCQRIADMLVARSTTLPARSMGVVLGEQLDWPARRRDDLGQDSDALRAASALDAAADERAADCSRLRDRLTRFIAFADAGEVALLQRDIDQSVADASGGAPR